jgi:hypothetical protein
MGEGNKMKLIPILIISLIICMGLADAIVTGSETLTRTAPASVQPGSTFALTYTLGGGTPPWTVILDETISGGCVMPNGGDTYRALWLSDDGATKTVNVVAPASGNCVLSGTYVIGNVTSSSFPPLAINIAGSSTCTNPVVTCGLWGACANNIQTRTCTDSCGGSSTQTQVCTINTTCPTGGSCGNQTNFDICKYMQWGSFINKTDPCIGGIIVSVAGLIMLLIILKK